MYRQTKRSIPNGGGYGQNGRTLYERMGTPTKQARKEEKVRRSTGNVEEFLAFEPTETPKWREETMTKDAPPISQMLKDIVRYKKRYEELKKILTETDRKKILEDLLVRFLCTIQKEEDIGVKQESLTKSLMRDTDEGTNGSMSKDMEKMLQGRKTNYERNNSLELPSIELDRLSTTPEKSRNETINLYKAYRHIKDEIKRSKNERKSNDGATGFETGLFLENQDDQGFIEVESLIRYTHKILMTDVMGGGTPPGQFSTYGRDAEFNGKIHSYPKFENIKAAEKAVQTLVDKVNEIIESIRQMVAPEEQKAKLYFKCSSLFLFCFLTLHPFGDGNGRLARLLSSYNLLTFSPFLTPIYNVFSKSRKSDYIQALVDARNNLCVAKPMTTRDEGINSDSVQPLIEERYGLADANHISTEDEAINLTITIMHQEPTDLCSMLIESNWTVWRQLLVKLGDMDIKLYEWEIENQLS